MLAVQVIDFLVVQSFDAAVVFEQLLAEAHLIAMVGLRLKYVPTLSHESAAKLSRTIGGVLAVV